MNINYFAVLGGTLGICLSATIQAQESPSNTDSLQEVVVTGSRTVKNGNDSPTPVTAVSAQQLEATTPSNIPDALLKLPQFSDSNSTTTFNNPGSNNVGNFLNLRGFGAIRTLVLVDGRRAQASAADGEVDINTLPQMLLERVDVVTGGASAVYGSDAVTGVVNFVLDHNFNGVKIEAQGGESGRHDDGSWKFGIAAGDSFLDHHLHLEGSFEAYKSDGISNKNARPIGAAVYCRAGSGSAADPYYIASNCRGPVGSAGGYIVSGPATGQQFLNGGTLTPFVNGPTVGPLTQIGGSGTYIENSSLAASLATNQLFGRADLALAGDTKAFLQATWTQSSNYNDFAPIGTAGSPYVLSTSNPFLSPALQQQLSAGGATNFALLKQFSSDPSAGVAGQTTDVSATLGLEGKVAEGFHWDLAYTHGVTTLVETAVRNTNTQRLAAALDAVSGPGGSPVCSAALTNPGAYSGCVPLNPFGSAPQDLSYVLQNTNFTMQNTMDDIGGTISGDVFQDWAGPISAALNGEWRRLKLTNATQFTPNQFDDCTGISLGCSPTTQLWFLNTTLPMNASEDIGEVALEATAPLAKDVPFAKTLDLNGAVRMAHYSISGTATTWKLGLVWRPIDDVTFRVTRSRDFRAPTLYDLYQPATRSLTGFFDSHTGVNGFTYAVNSGNGSLVPEVAQTWTAGFVLQPAWLPRFSLAVDYYSIRINNAIQTLGNADLASADTQCNASGGTSPLCAIFVRPHPLSDTSAANYPTSLLETPLNLAREWTRGLDIEANYALPLPGASRLDLRALANYQPTLDSVTFPGQPTINAAGTADGSNGLFAPTWKLTGMAAYSNGPWTANLQTRWRSSLAPTSQGALPGNIWSTSRIAPVAYTDLALNYNFSIGTGQATAFVSVQNAFDKQSPPYSTQAGFLANFYDPVVPGDDVVGRYITLGLRMRL